MLREFLDLGVQPLANGFLSADDIELLKLTNHREVKSPLRVGFDEKTNLVSLIDPLDKYFLFNDRYAYHSSSSKTMIEHFGAIAKRIQRDFAPKRILEIGSNDGVFLKHFDTKTALAVEPCGNFANMTNAMGYTTYGEFWSMELANEILRKFGPVDVVYAANCMCHIDNVAGAFAAVEHVMSKDGVFIFEDPSLLGMVINGAYDQIYDEHAHIFSLLALKELLDINDLRIVKVEHLTTHGGSNRVFAKKSNIISWGNFVSQALAAERTAGLNRFDTFEKFAEKVVMSRTALRSILRVFKNRGLRIIGYGATSKSTVIYNYCGIGPDLLDCVTDTTPGKQGKYTPGTHIRIVAPEVGMSAVDIAFLGAWNYLDEIRKKEKEFLDNGGKFVTHVPVVRVIGG